MTDTSDDLALHLQTTKDAGELAERLQQYQPWGHKIVFSNGVSTADMERRVPFNEFTLSKMKVLEKAIPFDRFAGGRVLDIGSNSGHNSIYACARYGMRATGIDVTQRHLDVSRMLAEMAGVDADYLHGDAETWLEEGQFDVVLHLGTLYHLPNPLLSLQSTWRNLKPGGWLGLETQVYEHADDPNISYFMHMHNNDKTNFWALSPHVIHTWLALLGFRDIRDLHKHTMPILGPGMSRLILVAHKPESQG